MFLATTFLLHDTFYTYYKCKQQIKRLDTNKTYLHQKVILHNRMHGMLLVHSDRTVE